MHINQSTVIPAEHAGYRLDKSLALIWPDFSRMWLKRWIESGQIQVNGAKSTPKVRVKGGEDITLNATLEDTQTLKAQDIPLKIVFEDEQILVIDKPNNLVVHPGAGNPDGTLVNALLHHDPALAKLPRAGIVHRIDKNTTGLLVIAKTLTAHNALIKQLQARTLKREYDAIVLGEMISGGTIREPIGRHPRNRLKMAVIPGALEAITHYRITKKYPHFTHLTVNLETGRTHQIRVHCAYLGFPIIGDQTYLTRRVIPKGINAELYSFLVNFTRQALHAKSLTLIHPTTGNEKTFQSALPADMQQLLLLLNK